MIVRIKYQGSDVQTVNAQDRWTPIRYSLGLRILANGDAALINGIGNGDSAGGIFVHEIDVDGAPLMTPGNHYLPPRCVLPIRKSPLVRDPVSEAHLPKRRQAWMDTGVALANKARANIASGLARPSDGFFFPRMGPWYPHFSGQPQPGATSGAGLEFLPGWERNSTYRLLLADHTMHRAAIAYVDRATGKPLPKHNQPNYGLSRGWSKSTQLAEFCSPASLSPYDDNRIPREANSGTCAYHRTITGLDRYNGCLAEDGQHLIRLYRHALAGWQVFGDDLCKLYLELIAGDAALRWGTPPAVTQGQGAGWIGRETGWVTHLFKSIQHRSGKKLDTAFATARMQNSLHQRCAKGPWGFAPDPWTSTPPYAGPSDHITQSIEAAIVGHACSDPYSVAEALTRNGNPSHFMLVAPNKCVLDLRASIERESFNVWAVWGKALSASRPAQKGVLLSRIPTMRLPDDGKSYQGPSDLLAGMLKSPHIGVLAPAIKAMDEM